MSRVKVPNHFFKKERQQLYANWPAAFWRELMQNALDAGSGVITIALAQCGDYVRVQFSDDGPGMDRSVLENVYFCLGETTKGGPHDLLLLGGFGRARILTCFSMRAYEMHTQDLRVHGIGADYSISEAEPIDGCHLTIDIDDASLVDMERSLGLFLRQSQISSKIIVNGAIWKDWAIRGEVIKELKAANLEFATVYANSNGLLNHVIVRSRGIQSYFQITHVPMQVVIEIVPQMARTVLTGNRDGMLIEYSRVLDQFLEDITLNTSILTPQQLRQNQPEPATRHFSLDDAEDVGHLAEYVWLFDDLGGKSRNRYRPATWADSSRRLMQIWRSLCAKAVQAMALVSQVTEFNWAVGWFFGDPNIEAVTKRDFSENYIHVFCLNPLDHSGQFWFRDNRRELGSQVRRLLALAAHEAAHGRHFSHDEKFAVLLTEIIAVLDQQECLNLIQNQKTPNVDRTALLSKPLGKGHLLGLQIMIENETSFPDGMTHAEVQECWPHQAVPGSQDPAHSRVSELADCERWGETLIKLSGKVRGPAGRPVTRYKVTDAGRDRYSKQQPKPLFDLPELSDEDDLQAKIQAAYPTMNNLTREFYIAIHRAGSRGVTIRELSYTTFARVAMNRDRIDHKQFRHNFSSRITHIRPFGVIDESESDPARGGRVLKVRRGVGAGV